jgi:predicted RND superfamily exporter protein
VISRFLDAGRRHPRISVLVFLLLVIAAGIAALDLRVDTSAEGVLLENDPDRARRDYARDVFGTVDEVIVVMVEAPDVFEPKTIAALRRLTSALERLPQVQEVLGLTNVEVPQPGWHFDVRPIAGSPYAPVHGEALRRRAMQIPILRNNLVSPDGKATAINVILKEYGTNGELLARGVEGIQRAAAAWDGPGRVIVAGIPVTKVAIAKLMQRDLLRLTPATIVIVVLLLFASFRSVRGVLLPMVAIGAGEVLTLGCAALTGRTVSVVSVVIPSVVLAIGCTYVVHLFPALAEDARRHRTQTAVFLSALTSLVGFLSLLTSRIHTIRDHGIFASIGVACMFAAAIWLLPALDRLFPGPVRDRTPILTGATAMRRLGAWILSRPAHIALVSAVIVTVSVLGMLRVRVETDYLAYFHPSHAVPRDIQRVNERISGVVPMMVLVDTGRDYGLDDPAMLRKIHVFQEAIERIPGIQKTLALPDVLSVVQRSLKGEDPSKFWLPAAPGEAGQLLQMIEFAGRRTAVSHYVDPMQRIANVYVRAGLVSSRELERAIHDIEQVGRTIFGSDVTLMPTGTMAVLNKTSGSIASGILSSLFVATVMIALVMCIHLRSVKLGLLAMVPNALPIAVLFGAMGAMGVTLSTGTSVAASIALGMIVDETIHFVDAYRGYRVGGLDPRTALNAVFVNIGPPIVWSSLILTAGFAVLVLSAFLPLVYLGIFMAITLFASLLLDLFLLPVLVVAIDRD